VIVELSCGHVTNHKLFLECRPCSVPGIILFLPYLCQLVEYPYIQVYNSLGTAATLMCVAFYNTVHFTASEFLWGVLGASNNCSYQLLCV
jgi:hypothetical protein